MNGGPSKSGCLTEDALTDYLEGALSAVARNACEAHLVTCDRCRRHLALFMRVLQPDLTPHEEVALQKLTEVSERRGVRVISARPARFHRFRGLAYVLGGVAAIVLLLGGAGLLPRRSTPSAGEITATLLARIRPFEPRIAGQPYRAVEEVTRGPEDRATFDALEEEMTDRAAEAYEMGQFLLIEKNYADAIRYLRMAAADPSAGPEVHNDLGVAYLQSGEAAFGLAENEFKAALKQNPDHAPALFNLSILYEREGLSGEAEKTWRQYLQVDRESGWAQELKRKLEGEGAVKP